MALIERIFLPKRVEARGDFKSYIKSLESGSFRGKVVYGVSDFLRDFYKVDPVETPGALFIGGMGSGKTVAMRFSVVTHMLSNSEDTVYLFFDSEKSMGDYKVLMNYRENVASAIDDVTKIVPMIEMVFDEMEARKHEFSKHGVGNIKSYNSKMKSENPETKNLSNIIMCFEEFHSIPNTKQMNFRMNYDREGSLAEKLLKIARVGRSYGINIMIANQRATSEEVPSQIKPALSVLMAFKVNQSGEAASLNLPHNEDITATQRGKCAYEQGFMQFPFLASKGDKKAILSDPKAPIKPIETIEGLMEKYRKPYNGRLLSGSVQKFQEAFEAEGNSGIVKIKPLTELFEFYQQYDTIDIIEKVLSTFKYTIEKQTNKSFIANLIAYKNDKKYFVKFYEDRRDGSDPETQALIRGAKNQECDGIIAFGIDNSIPRNVEHIIQEKAPNLELIKVEWEELIQAGKIIDEKDNTDRDQFNESYMSLTLSDHKDIFSEEELATLVDHENEIKEIEDTHDQEEDEEQNVSFEVVSEETQSEVADAFDDWDLDDLEALQEKINISLK